MKENLNILQVDHTWYNISLMSTPSHYCFHARHFWYICIIVYHWCYLFYAHISFHVNSKSEIVYVHCMANPHAYIHFVSPPYSYVNHVLSTYSDIHCISPPRPCGEHIQFRFAQSQILESNPIAIICRLFSAQIWSAQGMMMCPQFRVVKKKLSPSIWLLSQLFETLFDTTFGLTWHAEINHSGCCLEALDATATLFLSMVW